MSTSQQTISELHSNPSIPDISDADLAVLVERIKPTYRPFETDTAKGNLYYMKPVDPRGVAFTWDPKPMKHARDLVELVTFPTYHSFGYHGFFKPSIAEVLAQIPAEYREQAVAFETRIDDENSAFWPLVNKGFHLANTTLYTKKATPK